MRKWENGKMRRWENEILKINKFSLIQIVDF